MNQPLNPLINDLVCIGFTLLLIIAGAGKLSGANASSADDPLSLPEPTGTYGIGTTLLHLTDPSRLEEMSPAPDDHRELMVQVWYPTEKGPAGETFRYTDEHTSAYLAERLPEAEGSPEVDRHIYTTVQTHAVYLAEPATGPEPFPLLIFSPGRGVNYSGYQAFIEDIVSHGYIVAAVNHPYISGITVFPDGRSILGRENDNGNLDQTLSEHSIVVEDLKFITGELEAVSLDDTILVPDVDNIGFLGHSFGGSAAAETCLQLPQAKGALVMDGSLFGEQHHQPIDKPLFFMQNQDISIFSSPGLATAWQNISQDGYMMQLNGSTHSTFTDYGLLYYQFLGPDMFETSQAAIGMGNIDPQTAIQIIREYNLAFFDSCLKGTSPDNISAIEHFEATLERSEPADIFSGTWQSSGYGYTIEVNDADVVIYEMTDIGRLQLYDGGSGRIHNNYIYAEDSPQAKLAISDNTLVLTRRSGKEYTFEPVDETQLPAVIDPTTDPELNFEVLWRTFEEHCSLFQLTQVDWKGIYDQYRPQVDANTTDEALFDVFSAMVTPLNDGHTMVIDAHSDPMRVFSPGPIPSERWTTRRSAHLNKIASYMSDGTLHSEADGQISYGIMDGGIGYLNILSFEKYAPSSEEAASIDLEKMYFNHYLDSVLNKFSDLKGLVLDCRFNGGGDDALALALAERFTPERKLAFSKQVRIGGYDEFSALSETYIEPSHRVTFLGKPVVLLTSNLTASAADVFTMTMEQLDTVTLIGEKTYGMFSDQHTRSLPNGWKLALSNERYYSWEGIDYEQQGITPDIEIPYDQAETDEDKDIHLERSLEHLNTDVTNPEDSKDDKPKDNGNGSCFISSCIGPKTIIGFNKGTTNKTKQELL